MTVLLTRDDIIAQWNQPSNPLLAAGAAPVATSDANAKTAAEVTVTSKIAALKDAAAAVLAAQQADPDSASDPADAKVLAGIEAINTLIANLEKDQATDSAANPPEPEPDAVAKPDVSPPPPVAASALAAAPAPLAPVDTPAGSEPGSSTGVPGDADDSPPNPGDIDPTLVCENPECSHVASVHGDTADGQNQGACTTPGCVCPGMVPPADVIAQPDNPTAGDAAPENNAGDRKSTRLTSTAPHATAATAFADAPPVVPTPATTADAPAPPQGVTSAPPSGDTLPSPDPDPNATLMGPQFTIPVGIIEGLETGDGRIIADGALIWRTPPLPLMGLSTSPHPAGFDPNLPAVLIGRIDYVMRAAADNGVLQAGGYLLPTKEGMEGAQIIEGMKKMGVSADVGEAEVDSVLDGILPDLPDGIGILLDEDGGPDMPTILDTLTKGTILGFTCVPNAAFADCFIVLGDGSDQPPLTELVDRTAAPAAPLPAPTGGTEAPMPVAASAMWRIVSEDACEPCATGVPLVASAGGGPLAPPSAWFTDPAFATGGERATFLRETLDPKTGRATGKFACPPTVTEDGECFGHLAQWGVCHIGPQYRGKCMLAPRSQSDYAMWYTGQVLTAEGEMVDTGPLTAGIGHAPDNFSAAAALAHYDNVRNAVAHVVVGEDDYGIWYHGSISPSATPEQVFTMRASSFSGDWRPIGSRLELVAALAVNRPGFPQVKAHRSKGRITSLIAAGVPVFELAETKPFTIEERMDRSEERRV